MSNGRRHARRIRPVQSHKGHAGRGSEGNVEGGFEPYHGQELEPGYVVVEPGYVVVGDGSGEEWAVYAPEVVAGLRAGCAICAAGGEHDA